MGSHSPNIVQIVPKYQIKEEQNFNLFNQEFRNCKNIKRIKNFNTKLIFQYLGKDIYEK
jgi:hypothetical protein